MDFSEYKLNARVVYLVILYIIIVDFFSFNFYGYFSNDVKLIITILWFLIGGCFFKGGSWAIIKPYLTPLKFIIGGMFLSMIMAFIFYNQSLLDSLFCYRFQYIYFCFIPFLLVAPTSSELAKSLKIYALIYAIAYLFLRQNPGYLAITEEYMENVVLRHMEQNEFWLLGYSLMCVGLVFYLSELVENFSILKLGIIIFLYIILLLIQNRGTLLVMIPLLFWCILKVQSNFKIIIYFCVAAITIYFISVTQDLWLSLFEETTSQVNDNEYARVKAINYFVFDSSPNILCLIFGNGLISAHTSNLLSSLQADQIYNSDVGMIGYWNQYGILGLSAYIYMCVKILRDGFAPLWSKLLAAMVLLNPITAGYIAKPEAIMVVFIVYYAYIIRNNETYSMEETWAD